MQEITESPNLLTGISDFNFPIRENVQQRAKDRSPLRKKL
jgi:hypothetical protein